MTVIQQKPNNALQLNTPWASKAIKYPRHLTAGTNDFTRTQQAIIICASFTN